MKYSPSSCHVKGFIILKPLPFCQHKENNSPVRMVTWPSFSKLVFSLLDKI